MSVFDFILAGIAGAIELLQQRLGITTVYVTHDQEEAMVLSDRIAVMDAGQIRQIAPPEEIYLRPANRAVAAFFGMPNLLDAKVRAELRTWLRRLHDDTGYTTLFVTHDESEAVEIADRVVRLDQGRVSPS